MNMNHGLTAEEVIMRFGRWHHDGYRVLTIEPKKLLRVNKRGFELLLAVELNDNIYEFTLGELPEIKPVTRISTTPQGKNIYRAVIWNNCHRTRWRLTFRGVAEPGDFELLNEIVEFYDKVPMGPEPEDFEHDELPPRGWEVIEAD